MEDHDYEQTRRREWIKRYNDPNWDPKLNEDWEAGLKIGGWVFFITLSLMGFIILLLYLVAH